VRRIQRRNENGYVLALLALGWSAALNTGFSDPKFGVFRL
jgi:hypothetical protein